MMSYGVLGIILILLIINYFENKKRWKHLDNSMSAFIKDLDTNAAKEITKLKNKAEEIAEKNGIDFE